MPGSSPVLHHLLVLGIINFIYEFNQLLTTQ
jgi:hypothetical protein